MGGWPALRRGRVGVDLIAVLSLIGTLLVGEYLAGALIAVMLAGGRALEAAAERRASHDLRALLEHAPRFARRRVGSAVSVIALDEVAIDDLLVVGPGEVVPVDGRIVGAAAVLDESVLTGEPLQVERGAGEPVRSGVVNAGSAFEMRATATAAASTYAQIVRLAAQAGAENAPVVRLADRYAAWFLPLTLLVAGGAWLASGSAVRAVAVLVVATPCPLLLAAPVAIVSGLSRASRHGVVIRSGGALENLGHATTLVMDKTGTLTMGRPVVIDVAAAPGRDATEILRLAASVDQMSPHVLAEAIVTEALARGLRLSLPTDVVEEPGRGVTATVDDRRDPGRQTRARHRQTRSGPAPSVNRALLDTAAIAWVCVDGRPAGAVLLRDPLRRDAPRTVRRLRAAGLNRLVMLTGDRAEPAREVAAVLGLDEVYAEQSPADKVAAVRAERGPRGDRDGRRRGQRRPRAGCGQRRRRDGRARCHRLLGGRRHRVDHRPAGAARRRDGHRPLVAAHRRAERRRRHGPVAGRDGRRRARMAAARRGRAAAGGHRRRRDPQRAARPARQSGRRGRPARSKPNGCCGASTPNTTNCATPSDCCGKPPTTWPPRRSVCATGDYRARTACSPSGSCPTNGPRRPSSTRRWPTRSAPAKPPRP